MRQLHDDDRAETRRQDRYCLLRCRPIRHSFALVQRVATTTNCRHCDGIARLDAVANAGDDDDAAAGAFAGDGDDDVAVAGDVAAAAGVNDCGDGGAAAGFATFVGFAGDAGVAGVVADARTKTVPAAAPAAAVMLSPPSSG